MGLENKRSEFCIQEMYLFPYLIFCFVFCFVLIGVVNLFSSSYEIENVLNIKVCQFVKQKRREFKPCLHSLQLLNVDKPFKQYKTNNKVLHKYER